MNIRLPRYVLLSALLATVICLPSATAQDPAAGLQLTYEGSLIADQGDPVETRKQFDLVLTVQTKSDSEAVIYWVVNEQGNTTLPWPYCKRSITVAL